MPLSALWAPRRQKVGAKYGLAWVEDRFPFYAEDFDWSYFNAAPEDQQLPGYLRGDEDVVFQHLHPDAPTWSLQLPGLRVRAFVKDDQDVLRDVPMVLDTLYADLDAGRLYLTWRGLTPVREFDLADAQFGLLATERLDAEPLSQDHYRELLEAFQADPIGLEKAMPAGFLAMGQAYEAAEDAELAGDPPPGGPTLRDPLGIREQVLGAFPPGFLELAEQIEAGELPAEGNPLLAAAAAPLALAGEHMSPEDREAIAQRLTRAWEALPPEAQATLRQEAAKGAPAVASPPPPPLPPEVLEDLQRKSAELEERRQALVARGVDSPLLGLFALGQRLIARWTDPLPSVPTAGAGLSSLAEGLQEAKAALEKAPIPAERRAELEVHVAEQEQALEQLLAAFPPPPPVEGSSPDGADYSGQDLSGQSFAGQDLARANFSQAILRDADFSGAQLEGASFAGALLLRANLAGARLERAALAGADLRRANLEGASLDEADLRGANLSKARLRGAAAGKARLQGATLKGAQARQVVLSGASLEQADLREADLSQARLDGARLTDAVLTEALAEGADFTDAQLESAQLQRARLAGAKLADANLRFALLDKADLRDAVLRGADLSLAAGERVRADGADLSGAVLELTNLSKSRLRGASLRGAGGKMAQLGRCDLSGADLSDARLSTCDLGEATLTDANLRGADLSQASLRGVIAHRAAFVGATLTQAAVSEGADLAEARLMQIQAEDSVWLGARLTDADFSYAELRRSHLHGVHGDRVSFYAANLREAGLRKAKLVDPQFVSADLCHADLTFTTLVKAGFQQSNCYSAKFLGAQLASCDFTLASLDAALFDEGARP
jgi:uncharacterized protein YjbI with pentapeptide repeats